MPASLVAVTAAQDVLLSNQFPSLYDAASGGHHLTLTPRLVGFIRLVVILCVLRYLGCRPVVKLHSANIAAHISVMGCFFMGGACVGYCAAISRFLGHLQGPFCSISQHTTRGPGSQGGVRMLSHAPGGASQSNRGHMHITSNSELRAQLTSYYDWMQ